MAGLLRFARNDGWGGAMTGGRLAMAGGGSPNAPMTKQDIVLCIRVTVTRAFPLVIARSVSDEAI